MCESVLSRINFDSTIHRWPRTPPSFSAPAPPRLSAPLEPPAPSPPARAFSLTAASVSLVKAQPRASEQEEGASLLSQPCIEVGENINDVLRITEQILLSMVLPLT